MKHQYESEILFHLMERDGFNIPSSVPPYESEIKAYLINQVKQAYPKLTDYEAEWLLYNYTKHLPADFPIRSATNVTKATFENVVPFAYQSAILKGQTLVNLLDKCFYIATPPSIFSRIATSKIKVTTGKKYLLNCLTNHPLIVKYHENNVEIQRITNGNNNIIISSKYDDIITVITNGSDVEYNVKINLLEYIDNMENWDIPYFEGMQSVKLATLNPVGKNLFNINRGFIETKATYSINGSSLTVTGEWYVRQDIDLKPNTSYTLSYEKVESVNGYIKIATYANNLSTPLGTSNTNELTFKTPTSLNNVSVIFYAEEGRSKNTVTYTNIQLEEGSVATSYEPYKSIILSTPSDLELRGIREVQDTLDCLTGEVTERIGEVVLDGTEDWIRFGAKDDITLFHLNTNNYRVSNYEITCVAPLKTVKYGDYYPDVWEDSVLSLFSNYHQRNKEGIAIFSNKQSVDEFKSWLSQNPLKMVIMLKNPTVKTVDLETVNESGESVHFMPLEGTMHVQSSGEIIQPTFDMSVPVEATTQNLASFIDLEMEE